MTISVTNHDNPSPHLSIVSHTPSNHHETQLNSGPLSTPRIAYLQKKIPQCRIPTATHPVISPSPLLRSFAPSPLRHTPTLFPQPDSHKTKRPFSPLPHKLPPTPHPQLNPNPTLPNLVPLKPPCNETRADTKTSRTSHYIQSR